MAIKHHGRDGGPVRGKGQLVGHGSPSRRTAPNQDVWTEVGAVRPDDGAGGHLRGPKNIWIVPNGREHRPDQERLDIAFDDRPIGQDEAEVETVERRDAGDSNEAHRRILLQRSARLSGEQAATKMTASPKDDWALDGHLECEARAAHQADPWYSARLDRCDAWFGKAATTALCAHVGG